MKIYQEVFNITVIEPQRYVPGPLIGSTPTGGITSGEYESHDDFLKRINKFLSLINGMDNVIDIDLSYNNNHSTCIVIYKTK